MPLCKRKKQVGREKLAQILTGSKSKELKKFSYDKTVYYGRLNVFRKSEIERMIDQLFEMGYIKAVGGFILWWHSRRKGKLRSNKRCLFRSRFKGDRNFEKS